MREGKRYICGGWECFKLLEKIWRFKILVWLFLFFFIENTGICSGNLFLEIEYILSLIVLCVVFVIKQIIFHPQRKQWQRMNFVWHYYFLMLQGTLIGIVQKRLVREPDTDTKHFFNRLLFFHYLKAATANYVTSEGGWWLLTDWLTTQHRLRHPRKTLGGERGKRRLLFSFKKPDWPFLWNCFFLNICSKKFVLYHDYETF